MTRAATYVNSTQHMSIDFFAEVLQVSTGFSAERLKIPIGLTKAVRISFLPHTVPTISYNTTSIQSYNFHFISLIVTIINGTILTTHTSDTVTEDRKAMYFRSIAGGKPATEPSKVHQIIYINTKLSICLAFSLKHTPI